LAAPRVLAAVLAVAARLDAAGVPWLLTGSAGRALLGFARRPRDVDVEVEEARMEEASRALGVAPAYEDGSGRAGWRAVAEIRGVEVDLTAGLQVTRADGRPPLCADFALEEGWAHTVLVAGRPIRVAPVEEQIALAIAGADWARLARVAAGAPEGFRLRPAYLERRLSAAASAAS
jgi:hypothetical protein